MTFDLAVDILKTEERKNSDKKTGFAGAYYLRGIIMEYKSDIDIAQAAKPEHITAIAGKCGIEPEYVEQYGQNKAKISLDLLKTLDS